MARMTLILRIRNTPIGLFPACIRVIRVVRGCPRLGCGYAAREPNKCKVLLLGNDSSIDNVYDKVCDKGFYRARPSRTKYRLKDRAWFRLGRARRTKMSD